jgi:hypothetical protein
VARYAVSSPKWLQATTVFLAFVVEKWFLPAKKELLYNPPQSRLKFNPCHKPLYEQPE